MGMLDGVLGGLVGGGTAAMIGKLIDEQGGLQSLVGKFEQNGLGGVMQSWVGNGANEAVAPDQIKQALGSDMVKNLAGKFGLSEDDLAAQLAKILPETVDKMTPSGNMSDAA